MATSSGLLSAAPITESFKCCSLRLSDSAAEPFGKDCMALLTASGKTWSGGETVDGTGRLSAEAAGCRQLSAAKVESSGTASLSSEHSSRTAPFTSPSSSLADAIAAATWSPVFDLMLRAVGQLGGSGSVPSSYCMSCFKTDVVKLRDLPPRVGFTRHDEEKPSSLDQLDEHDGCIRRH